MPAANHGKGIRARKIRRPRHLADRLLPRVNQVSILLTLDRIRPNPQHPILTLQHNFNPRRNVIRDKRRHPNAEIHIDPIPQFQRNPFHDAFAFVQVFHNTVASGRWSVVSKKWSLSRFGFTAHCPLFLPFFSQSASRKLPPEKSASHKSLAYARRPAQSPRPEPDAPLPQS